jgi:hypothetical protein
MFVQEEDVWVGQREYLEIMREYWKGIVLDTRNFRFCRLPNCLIEDSVPREMDAVIQRIETFTAKLESLLQEGET